MTNDSHKNWGLSIYIGEQRKFSIPELFYGNIANNI